MHIPKIDGPPKSVANLFTTLAPPRLIQQQQNWDENIFERALTIIIKSRSFFKDVNHLSPHLLALVNEYRIVASSNAHYQLENQLFIKRSHTHKDQKSPS